MHANAYLKADAKVSEDQIVRIPTQQNVQQAKIIIGDGTTTTQADTIPIKKEASPTVSNPVIDDKVIIIDPETQQEVKEEQEVKEVVEHKPIVSPVKVVKVKQATPKKHKVTLTTETLYSIAREHNTTPAKLMKWNNLKTETIRMGYVLVVEDPTNSVFNKPATPASKPIVVAKAAKKDSAVVIAKPKKAKQEQPDVITEKPITKKVKNDSSLAIKPSPAAQGPAADIEKPKAVVVEAKPVVVTPPTYVPNAPNAKKTFENGIAEVIDAGEKTDKYLGLHKTATIGTLVQVRNEANNKSVWVKIIGKLPESEESMIKISPKAFEKLLPSDKRIRAEISYIK